MYPVWTLQQDLPAEGFEPPTYGLQNRCTTTVLSRHGALIIADEGSLRSRRCRRAPRSAQDISLVPTAHRIARGLVERAGEQPALRHLDFIQCTVGHGQEGRTAVLGVHPWHPRVI